MMDALLQLHTLSFVELLTRINTPELYDVANVLIHTTNSSIKPLTLLTSYLFANHAEYLLFGDDQPMIEAAVSVVRVIELLIDTITPDDPEIVEINVSDIKIEQSLQQTANNVFTNYNDKYTPWLISSFATIEQMNQFHGVTYLEQIGILSSSPDLLIQLEDNMFNFLQYFHEMSVMRDQLMSTIKQRELSTGVCLTTTDSQIAGVIAYWSLMRTEFDNNKFDRAVSFINEIKFRLIDIYCDPAVESDLNDRLSLTVLLQQLPTYTPEQFYSLTQYILSWILPFQNEDSQKQTNKVITDILTSDMEFKDKLKTLLISFDKLISNFENYIDDVGGITEAKRLQQVTSGRLF